MLWFLNWYTCKLTVFFSRMKRFIDRSIGAYKITWVFVCLSVRSTYHLSGNASLIANFSGLFLLTYLLCLSDTLLFLHTFWVGGARGLHGVHDACNGRLYCLHSAMLDLCVQKWRRREKKWKRKRNDENDSWSSLTHRIRTFAL